MNLDQIDQALETWRANLLTATDNLLALDDNITYKRLEGKDGLPAIALTGLTQKRVTPALEAMHALFQYTGLLTKVVESATERRKSVSRFRGADNTAREIEELLYGPSIVLPPDQTPLAQRGLLSASETTNRITPEQLLAAMTASFDVARDAVFAVEAAWNKLETALGRYETELAALQRLAEDTGQDALPELLAARQRAEALHAQIESDPLGASVNFEAEMVPLLQNARTRLEQAVRQREEVVADLARARELETRLEATRAQCEAALRACQEKIGPVPGLRAPLDPARLAELTSWRATLEKTVQERRWQPARIGLTRWLTTASEYVNAESAAVAANCAPVERCAELRGRLSALKMKGQARGLGLDTALNAIAQEAERLLALYPVPLDRIAALVAEYETKIAKK